jgi:hypothetical protein
MNLYIRQGVIDVQSFVPAMKVGHETLYRPSDFADEGKASLAVLPPQAEVRDAFLFNYNDGTRYPLLQFPWERRFELVTGSNLDLIANNGCICIDPAGYKFYVYPGINSLVKAPTASITTDPTVQILSDTAGPVASERTADFILSVNWDGQKLDFKDWEQTPFTEEMAAAVADYTMARIKLIVDENPAIAGQFMGQYQTKRTNLYLNSKLRTRVK